MRSEVLEVLHSANQGSTGMKARAAKCVYWPGINQAITDTRDRCRDCITIAPSNSKEPMIMTTSTYPFEKVVIDYLSMKGYKYVIQADRYSGWPSVVKIKPGQGDSTFLKGILNNLFATYGAPNELSSDGGSPFNSFDFQSYLKHWGITWRNSSAYYAQSNGRAELAVKTIKRILISNCDDKGDIDTMSFARALLQYRNTPLQDLGLSPAQILYGRELRDCMPTMEESLHVHKEWRIAAEEREISLRKRHLRSIETYNEHSKELPELHVHDCVAVQNQTGSHPKRWDKTGVIIETLPFRQFKVLMDGSRRVTLRNRRFLRKIHPVCSNPPLPTRYNTTCEKKTTPLTPMRTDTVIQQPAHSPSPPSTPPLPSSPPRLPQNFPTVENGEPGTVALRRSARDRQPREIFQAQLHGKSHVIVPQL